MNVHTIGSSAKAAGSSASAVQAWLRALALTKPIAEQPTRTLPAIIDELAEKFGEAPALLSDRECLTFRGLAAQSNRYARWALGQGLAKGIPSAC
jgi:fatty-acyl-CoA synthase